jgi:hypothetical protein
MSNSPVKVAEFGELSIVVEVYQKYVASVSKYFFEIVCASECVEGISRFLSPLTRVDDIPRLISGVVDAMEYISDRHKELRASDGSITPQGSSLPYKYSNSTCHGADGIEIADMQKSLSHIKEFKRGSVVCELYTEEINGVNVFKVCCWREYSDSEGSRQREFYIQQRDLRDLIQVLIKAQLYVKENWGSSGPVESKRW